MRDWSGFIGQPVSFDHNGKRLAGTITEIKDNGHTALGKIPDALVTIRGKSGTTVTVSLVESYLRLKTQ